MVILFHRDGRCRGPALDVVPRLDRALSRGSGGAVSGRHGRRPGARLGAVLAARALIASLVRATATVREKRRCAVNNKPFVVGEYSICNFKQRPSPRESLTAS